jgi:hypothetical protein
MKMKRLLLPVFSFLSAAALLAPSAATAQIVAPEAALPSSSLGQPLYAAPSLPAGFSVQPFSTLPGEGVDQAWLGEKVQSLRTLKANPTSLSVQRGERREQGAVGGRLGDMREEKARTNDGLSRVYDRTGRSQGAVSVSESRGLGILPGAPRTTVNGVPLDVVPTAPDVSIHPNQVQGWNVSLPTAGGRVRSWLMSLLGSSDEPPSLQADPNNPAAVEAALKAYFQTKPQDFGGLQPGELQTVFIRKVAGQAGLSDTHYAHFLQTKDGRPVDGTHVTVTMKVIRGKLSILSTRVRIFPNLNLDNSNPLPEDQLEEKARSRMGQQPNGGPQLEMKSLGQQVKHLGNQWRTVQVFYVQKHDVYVGVDIKTGESFAWEGRVQMAESQVKGRGTADLPPGRPDAKVVELPLAHLKLDVGGQTIYTDKDGKFTVPGSGDAPVKIKAALEGRFINVRNQTGADLSFEGEAKPGQSLVAVFNPEGQDEYKTALVNAYFHLTDTHEWMGAHGVQADSMDKPMPANVNIDDECNAYYTPGSPSTNYFKGSTRCANTSFASVARHEYGGHGFDDAIGGITNGGLSEALGDNVSMFMSGDPRIGVGFLLGQGDGSIRTGENDYKYGKWDEVHKQGLAFMGFSWLVRKALNAAQGQTGISIAEHLIIPVYYAKARDIPQAIHEVMLRDVDSDGKIPHLKILQDAAKKHGIDLKPPKGVGPVAALASFAGRTAKSITKPQAPKRGPSSEAFQGFIVALTGILIGLLSSFHVLGAVMTILGLIWVLAATVR